MGTTPAQHHDVYQPSVMDDGIRCVRVKAALRGMIAVLSKYRKICLLFYRSRGTLMSHGDRSAQRCFNSNTPVVFRPNIWQFGKREGGGG